VIEFAIQTQIEVRF